MPLFNFTCPNCKDKIRKLLSVFPEQMPTCPKCEIILESTSSAPTTRIVEIRDNGLMPRQIEQLADVGEMVRERSLDPEDPEII